MEEDPLSHYLHLCYRRMREDEGQQSVYDLIRLPPHAVIYEHHFPKHWLYYEGSKIFRKTGKDITDSGQIFRAYTEGVPKDDDHSVVAVFISYAKESTDGLLGSFGGAATGGVGGDGDGKHGESLSRSVRETLRAAAEEGFADETFNAHYLTRPHLALFLRERKNRTDHGVLLKFIKPRGIHTEAIKVHWSPHMSHVVQRVNQNTYSDASEDLYRRHDAFKNNLGFVRQHNAPPSLTERVVAVCNKMMQDVENAAGARMIHGTFFFQPAASGKMYFLFCNYAAVRRGQDVRPTQVMNPNAGFLPSNPDVEQLEVALDSFQSASMLQRYNFFAHYLMPRMQEASLSDRNILSSKELYMLDRFKALSTEVRKKEARGAAHARAIIRHYRAAEGEDKKSTTLAKLAQNMWSKAIPGENTAELEVLVRLVAGSKHSSVAAAVVVLAAACCDMIPDGPRRMQSVAMYRCMNLKKFTAAQRRHEKRALYGSFAKGQQGAAGGPASGPALDTEWSPSTARVTFNISDIPTVDVDDNSEVSSPASGAPKPLASQDATRVLARRKARRAQARATDSSPSKLTFSAPPFHAPLLKERSRNVTSMHSPELQRLRPGMEIARGRDALKIHIHNSTAQKEELERRVMRATEAAEARRALDASGTGD